MQKTECGGEMRWNRLHRFVWNTKTQDQINGKEQYKTRRMNSEHVERQEMDTDFGYGMIWTRIIKASAAQMDDDVGPKADDEEQNWRPIRCAKTTTEKRWKRVPNNEIWWEYGAIWGMSSQSVRKENVIRGVSGLRGDFVVNRVQGERTWDTDEATEMVESIFERICCKNRSIKRNGAWRKFMKKSQLRGLAKRA